VIKLLKGLQLAGKSVKTPSNSAIPILHLSAILATALVEALTHFGTITSADSFQYFNLTNYFLGIEKLKAPERMVRPLVPLLAAPFALKVGLPAAYGIINTAFYALTGVISYKLTLMVTNSRTTSLCSSFLILTSFPMIAYGAASGKEGGGVFFQLLAAYLAFKSAAASSTIKVAFYGLVSGAGSLSMEITLPAIAFGLLYSTYLRRYKEALIWVFSAALPQALLSLLSGYSLVDWYIRGSYQYAMGVGLATPYAWLNPYLRGKQLIAGLSPLAFLGVIIGFLNKGNAVKAKVFYLMVMPAVVAYFAWPPVCSRIAIVLYYASYWMAAMGVKDLTEKLAEKPLLNRVRGNVWLLLLLLLNAAFCNYLAYRWYLNPQSHVIVHGDVPGFSFPWSALRWKQTLNSP